MSIGSVGDYSSYLQNYRVPTIPSVSAEDVRRQDMEKRQQDVAVGSVQTQAQVPASVERPAQNAQLEDISITFNKQDSFDYLGKDSDINSLDMEKAISDMRKDQVMQQYQYFVGSARNLYEDGAVIQKS